MQYFICENCYKVLSQASPECPSCGSFHLISEEELRQIIKNRTGLLNLINVVKDPGGKPIDGL